MDPFSVTQQDEHWGGQTHQDAKTLLKSLVIHLPWTPAFLETDILSYNWGAKQHILRDLINLSVCKCVSILYLPKGLCTHFFVPPYLLEEGGELSTLSMKRLFMCICLGMTRRCFSLIKQLKSLTPLLFLKFSFLDISVYPRWRLTCSCS